MSACGHLFVVEGGTDSFSVCVQCKAPVRKFYGSALQPNKWIPLSQCRADVMPPRGWRSHPCGRPAVTEAGYCKIHDPAESAARAKRRGPTQYEVQRMHEQMNYDREMRRKALLKEAASALPEGQFLDANGKSLAQRIRDELGKV